MYRWEIHFATQVLNAERSNEIPEEEQMMAAEEVISKTCACSMRHGMS